MDGHSKCEKYTSKNQHLTYNKNSTNVNCVNVRPPNCVRPATWIEGNQLVRNSVVVLFGVRFKFNSTINLWKFSHCKSRAVGTTDHYSFNLFTDFLVVVAALKWSDYISHNAEQFHVQIFFLFRTHHNKIIIKFHSHRVPVGEGYRCTQWRCAMYSLWSLVWLFGWLFNEMKGKRLNIKIRSLKIPFTLCSNRYKNIDNFFFLWNPQQASQFIHSRAWFFFQGINFSLPLSRNY